MPSVPLSRFRHRPGLLPILRRIPFTVALDATILALAIADGSATRHIATGLRHRFGFEPFHFWPDRLHTLATNALFVRFPGMLVALLIVIAVSVGIHEWLAGTRRALLFFWGGNAIVLAGTAAFVALFARLSPGPLHVDWRPPGEVGASFGALVCLGAVVARTPPGTRLWLLGAAVLWLVVKPFFLFERFSDVGHLFGFFLGFTCDRALSGRRVAPPPQAPAPTGRPAALAAPVGFPHPPASMPDPIATVPLERCPLCGNPGPAFRRLPFTYRYAGASFPGGECGRCRLRGLVLQPAAHEFGRLYARGYFEGGDVRCGHVGDYFAERPTLLLDGASLVARFERLHGGPRRLLEVGCASGAVLEAAAARGWRVQGVEYSADAAAEARAHGVPVHVGGLESAGLPDGAFDVAFLGDVLEHVPDPARTLAETARVLAPGGALFLRGPITTHSIARRLGLSLMEALGRVWSLDEPPYHLWEFEPDTLVALVRRAGLRVEAFRQGKVAPSLRKRRGAAGVALYALDAVNAAWTAVTGTLGDRCEMVARKPHEVRAPEPFD